MKHHVCYCRSRGFPIFPIGTVNLANGNNSMHNTIWDCWSEDDSRLNILVRDDTKYRAIYSISTMSMEYQIGDTMKFCNDQTNAQIGDLWIIVGFFPHTKDGLLKMKEASGKTIISFATFK